MTGNTGPPTEEQLRFIQGLYSSYKSLIYKFARARSRNEAETDDVASETLLRLFRNADRLMELHEKELIDYVTQTVLSVAADHNRKNRAEDRRFTPLEEESLGSAAEADPEDALVERETEDALIRNLYETLDELSEADRRLLVGKYMDCLSDEALARQLGVKAASIRMKLSRARNRARKRMERKEAEDSG